MMAELQRRSVNVHGCPAERSAVVTQLNTHSSVEASVACWPSSPHLHAAVAGNSESDLADASSLDRRRRQSNRRFTPVGNRR